MQLLFQSHPRFEVLSQNVGHVIGRQGNFIKKAKSKFSINIQILTNNACNGFTPILLEGPAKSVDDCKDFILNRLHSCKLNLKGNSSNTHSRYNSNNVNAYQYNMYNKNKYVFPCELLE